MTFEIHTVETAPIDARPMMEKIVSSYGFLPNLAAGLAESPAVLGAFLGLAGAYDSEKMTLDSVSRQVVLLATSVTNECDYCMAAHSMLALKSGLAPLEVDRLVAHEPLQDARLEALRTFTVTIVEQRGRVTDAEITCLIAAGYDKAQILEVLLGVALKTFTNYANHLIGPEINVQFAAYAPKSMAEQASVRLNTG